MTASLTESSPKGFFDDVKSIAVVGVSNKGTKFGSSAYHELKQRGFEVYALHPSLATFEGEPCYHTAADLPAVPDCALVAVNPREAAEVVRQLSIRGIKRIWFQQGSDFSEAVAVTQQLGLQSVHGRCILMYAGQVTGIHKFHRFLSRLFGKY